MTRPNYLDFSGDVLDMFPPTFDTPKPFLPHEFVSDGISETCVICGTPRRNLKRPSDGIQRINKLHVVDGFEQHMFQFDPAKPVRQHEDCRHCGRDKNHAHHQDFSGKLAEWEKERSEFEAAVAARRKSRVARDLDDRRRNEKFAVLDERRTMSIIGSITSVTALIGGIGIGTWLF